MLEDQAPVVQKMDNAIHRTNHYPLYSAIGFPNTYPLDSDLSGGQRSTSTEQLERDLFPPPETLSGLGTSLRRNDFWYGVGGHWLN